MSRFVPVESTSPRPYLLPVVFLLLVRAAFGQGNPDIVAPGETRDCVASIEQWYRTDHTFAIDPNNTQVLYVNVEYE